MKKNKQQLALERYNKNYDDLCEIRQAVIDEIYEMQK